MKGIIIVDIPDGCTKCHYSHVAENDYKWFCGIKNKILDCVGLKPDWCPIKPIPEERSNFDPLYENDEWCDGWDSGWNACVNEITEGVVEE